MKEIIKMTVEDVKDQYLKNGVSNSRIERSQMKNDYSDILPDVFTITGLCFPEVEFESGKHIVPSFLIDRADDNTIPINLLFASYAPHRIIDGIKTFNVVQIKNGKYKDKWHISNSLKVNQFADNLSEVEFVSKMIKEKLKVERFETFPVFRPRYIDRIPILPDNEKDAFNFVHELLYPIVSIIGK